MRPYRAFVLAAAVAAWLPAAAAADEARPSLFFTPDEVRRAVDFVERGAIPEAGRRVVEPIADPGSPDRPEPAPVRVREPTPDIRLGALMYWSEANWVLWINGQAYRPDAEPPPFRILAVTDAHADIEWRSRDGAAVVRARLAPHQIRRGATGEIVGGAPGIR